MKKLITILLCLILTFGALSLTACGKKEYTMEDVIKVTDTNDNEISLSILTSNVVNTEYDGFILYAKKNVKITKVTYNTRDGGEKIFTIDSPYATFLCGEYQSGDLIEDYSNMIYNLVIEFEVIE